jgi:hypothetical protein
VKWRGVIAGEVLVRLLNWREQMALNFYIYELQKLLTLHWQSSNYLYNQHGSSSESKAGNRKP